MSSSDENEFTVNFPGGGERLDLDEVRARKQALMPGGKHAWVISSIYGLDDPEQEMDSMELGPENFVGVTPISCLLCNVEYQTEIRHEKCPQRIP